MEQIKDKCEISVLYIKGQTLLFFQKTRHYTRKQHTAFYKSLLVRASKGDALSRVEYKFRKYTWQLSHNRL